jgi:K+ transporter
MSPLQGFFSKAFSNGRACGIFSKRLRTALYECNGENRHRSPFGGDARLGTGGVACMGIVFGDIGTSPLYALSVAAKAASPDGQLSPQAVLGVVSLIFWSLIIVISIKYAILIMRADNHGEGGILALLALISPRRAKQSRRRAIMV